MARVSLEFSPSFWVENESLLLHHLLCLSFRSCDCVLLSTHLPISCSFPHFSGFPCIIKQQHKTKPSQAHLHRVSVVSHFFAMCLACHCFAASHRWRVWRGPEGLGLQVQASGLWGGVAKVMVVGVGKASC